MITEYIFYRILILAIITLVTKIYKRNKSRLKVIVYKVYGKQDKSDENRSKCQAVGSMVPHKSF